MNNFQIVGNPPPWRFDWTNTILAFFCGAGVVALLAFKNGAELADGQRDQLQTCADICAATCRPVSP